MQKMSLDAPAAIATNVASLPEGAVHIERTRKVFVLEQIAQSIQDRTIRLRALFLLLESPEKSASAKSKHADTSSGWSPTSPSSPDFT